MISVNEIFDSDQVDEFYASTAEKRASALAENRSTNYGVVRGGLLQEIYDDLYMQRLQQPDEQKWPHRILKHRQVVDAMAERDSVKLTVQHMTDGTQENLQVDAVIVAAGYSRDMHEAILDPVRHLTRSGEDFNVSRDYRVELDEARVSKNAGLWLQGCNETSHGVCASNQVTVLCMLTRSSAE